MLTIYDDLEISGIMCMVPNSEICSADVCGQLCSHHHCHRFSFQLMIYNGLVDIVIKIGN